MKKRKSPLLLMILFLVTTLILIGILLLFFRKDKTGLEEKKKHYLRVALWDYDVVDYDRKIIEAFEKQYPDIEVEVILYHSLFYNKSVDVLLDSDEQVDIVYINQLSQMHQLTSRDLALPLDSFIENDSFELDGYPDIDVLRSENGELLALPYRKDKFVLFYNKDLFKRAGLSSPQNLTWDDFRETASDLKNYLNDEENSIYLQWAALHLNYIFGGEATDPKTKEYASFRNQIEYLLKLQDEGLILPLSEAKNKQASQMIFETGKYGMYVQGTWYLNILKTDKEYNNFDFEWGVEAKPVWYKGANEKNALWMTPVCIHKNTRDPEAAWTFLKFVCGSNGAAILADELMIPAYENPVIRSRLEQNLRDIGIDPGLILDDYGEATPLQSPKQSADKNTFNQLYEDALSGFLTIDEAEKKQPNLTLN